MWVCKKHGKEYDCYHAIGSQVWTVKGLYFFKRFVARPYFSVGTILGSCDLDVANVIVDNNASMFLLEVLWLLIIVARIRNVYRGLR